MERYWELMGSSFKHSLLLETSYPASQTYFEYIETCISKANNKLKADGWEKIAEEVQTGRIWVGAKDESWAIASMEREKGEGTIVIALREKVKQEGPYIGRKES